MLRIGIIGCGKIADSHVSQIRRIPGCEIVAICDREPLMAKQLHDRFSVKQYFSDASDLLSEARPDVVHITTPPQSHFELAKVCLNAGCHVYVEKPFTLDSTDAQCLIALAEQKGLKLTAGHDDQFTHAARRMRKLVQDGYLGSRVIHMESYYGYELRGSYADALLSDKQHWVRHLPGKLLHNIISHGIARFAEYLTSDSPTVISHGFASPSLKSRGETEIIDEVRVIISDDDYMTGYFTFSSQMRPSLHQFGIYGSENGLVLYQDQETLIKLRGKRYPSYAEHFVPPFEFAGQYLKNFTTNFRSFLRRDFHMKSGMKFLIESFYRSISEGAPLPLSYREILLTAKIMDAIFAQLSAQQSQNGAPSVCQRR